MKIFSASANWNKEGKSHYIHSMNIIYHHRRFLAWKAQKISFSFHFVEYRDIEFSTVVAFTSSQRLSLKALAFFFLFSETVFQKTFNQTKRLHWLLFKVVYICARKKKSMKQREKRTKIHFIDYLKENNQKPIFDKMLSKRH